MSVFSQTIPTISKGIAVWYSKQRCSNCLIDWIGMRVICITVTFPASSHMRGRQYLAKVATGDEVTKILDLWRNPHLCPDRGNYALCLGKIGQFPRLAQAVAQRPFAINMLAGIQGSRHQLMVVRYLDGNNDKVDFRRAYECVGVLEGQRQTKCLSGPLRTGKTGIGHADDLVIVRQGLQRGDMGHSSPVNARIKDYKNNANSCAAHNVFLF